MSQKQNSPKYLQTSMAAAMTLKLRPGKFYRDARLNALNLLLLYEGGCQAKCSYCGLSKSRVIEPENKTFIRVDWPIFPLDDIIRGTKNNGKHLQRVCVSMITHRKSLDDMCTVMMRFKSETDLLISGLISPTMIKDKKTMDKIKAAGADMIGVAVDTATPALFDKHRGKIVNGPHKWDHYWEVINWSVEIFGMGNVGIHLIVGIGETEKEMVAIMQKAEDLGVKTHLFSFYPEAGSQLKDHKQPPYGQYRRIQLARYIINEGLGTYQNMKFNKQDQIIDFGKVTEEIINNGEAFMTSGCPGHDGKVACNRPFGNERPSRPMRNYPFLPNEEDIKIIRKQLTEY